MDEEQIPIEMFPGPALEADLLQLLHRHKVYLKFNIPSNILASTMCGFLAALYIHNVNVANHNEPDEKTKREINEN